MNKRTFLKLSSAVAATPILSPLMSWAAGEKLKNWAGNFEFSTEDVTPAKSLEQVQQYVKSHEKFKALGTRHCFNQIANSKHALLEMKPLDHAVSIDENERTVTVEPGMSYGQLAPYLDSKGWALHNLASLPHISVAGSCATATHGSGDNNGNLSSAVAALEMVTASGDMLKLSRKYDGEKFLGAVVHLGALGVVTKVTLNIQPTYQVRQVLYENLPMSALKDHFEQIMGAAYSVSLFTDWSGQKFSEVWLKSRVSAKEKFKAEPQFFGATLAKKNMHPIAALSAENCTEQMGVPGTVVRPLAALQDGFYSERRQGIAVGVFCAAAQRGRCDHGRRKVARTDHAALTHHGNSQHRGRRFVDESVPPPGLRDDSLHVEAGVARGACAAAADREGNPSVPRASALGQAFHDEPTRFTQELRQNGRVRRVGEVTRSERKIPQ